MLPSGSASYPVDPNVTLAEFERLIMSETDEIAAAFDAQGRLVLAPRRGKSDAVAFNEHESTLLEGLVVTHNHPMGGGFSAFDAIFAVERDVAEIRAVLPTGVVHTLTRPAQGWPDAEMMVETIEDAIRALRRAGALRASQGLPALGRKEGDVVLFDLRRDAFAKLGVRMGRMDVWR